jgi:hypothetical protein
MTSLVIGTISIFMQGNAKGRHGTVGPGSLPAYAVEVRHSDDQHALETTEL